MRLRRSSDARLMRCRCGHSWITAPSAPGAPGVRVWQITSRGRVRRAGCPPPEGVHVDYAHPRNPIRTVTLSTRSMWRTGPFPLIHPTPTRHR
jgi:hypothetical protein